MKTRLNHNCENHDEAIHYFKEQGIIAYLDNYYLFKIELYKEVVIAYFKKNDEIYFSIYVLKQYRGNGLFMYYYKEKTLNNSMKIVTSVQCNIENWLNQQNIQYSLINSLSNQLSYNKIESVYGIDFAKRSKVPFMNHIDEGLCILKWINASTDAMKAYCLHPVLQDDDSFKKNIELLEIFSSKVIALSTEYRNVANNYLSKDSKQQEIKLSPLKEVNDMLIADKIQNYKDFLLYHKETHPRSRDLDIYFKRWFDKLNVDLKMFNNFMDKLMFKDLEIENFS